MSLPMTDGAGAAGPERAHCNGEGAPTMSAATPPSRRQPTTKRRAAAAAALAALGTVALLNAVAFGDEAGAGVRGGAGAGRGRGGWARRFLSASTRRRLCASSYAARISRRLEEELCEASTPYVSQEDMAEMAGSTDAPDPRAVPSHVALCRELVTRHDLLEGGGSEADLSQIGFKEDEAVCMDWTSPHFSLMQIFASTLVSHVGNSNRLRMSYLHDCGSTLAGAPETTRDMTTVQQRFPSSSLILDDGPVAFDTVKRLCGGCIQEFESGSWDAYKDAHEKLSHHCLLYPGHAMNDLESVTFDDSVTEDAIEAERRELARTIPLGGILETVQNRLRTEAALTKAEIGNPLPREGLTGVVIPLDRTSGVIPAADYARAIGDGVESIQILSMASCATAQLPNGESCLVHGMALKKDLLEYFDPEVTEIRHDIVASTAAAFSRMILAKLLVVPPGTVSALLPALAKEVGTHAKIFESDRWPLTWRFFNFVRQHRNNIEVVDLDAREFVSGADGGTVLGEGGVAGAAGSTATEGVYGTGGISAPVAGAVGTTTHINHEDCVELRGRAGGSWEMDYDYDDLQDARMDVRGSNARGVNSADGRHGRAPGDARFQAQGRSADAAGAATWQEALEQCQLHEFTREDMCRILGSVGVGQIHFVGDYATLAQVRQLLQGMRIDPSQVATDADGSFRKRVGCEGPPRFSFEMVFTNNGLLDVQEGTQSVFNPNYVSGLQATGGGVNNYAGPVVQQQQPVGGYGGYMMPAMAMPMMPMAMPMAVPYAGACTCGAWTEGYQQSLDPQAGMNGGGRRKLLVAGMGASGQEEDLDAHKAHFDNFRRLAESVSGPDDIVVYRTTPPLHAYCAPGGGDGFKGQVGPGGSRRLAPAGSLSARDVREFNRFAKHEWHDMKRGHAVSSSPKNGRAQFHVLDVELVTAAHPDASQEGMKALRCDEHGRKLGSKRPGSDIHEHWNRMLFGMLRDIGEAERRRSQAQAPAQAQIPPQAQAAPQAQVPPPQQAQAPAPPQAQVPPQQVQTAPQAQAPPQQAQAGVPQGQVPPQAPTGPVRVPPHLDAPQMNSIGRFRHGPGDARPEDQPAASAFAQTAWERAAHAAAADKQSHPGHRVASP